MRSWLSNTDSRGIGKLQVLEISETRKKRGSANQQYSVDNGDRYRNQERIAAGFVESAINQVVSKRMVKKQQMPWTKKGERQPVGGLV